MLNPAQLRERRPDGERGFTLIELLVVVVIMGVLIAVAIPVYLNYKKDAADKSAESDLRNAVTTLELCLTDTGKYPQYKNDDGTLNGCDQQLNTSKGTLLYYLPQKFGTSLTDSYLLIAWNSNGAVGGGLRLDSKFYCYDSEAGGSVKSTDIWSLVRTQSCG